MGDMVDMEMDGCRAEVIDSDIDGRREDVIDPGVDGRRPAEEEGVRANEIPEADTDPSKEGRRAKISPDPD
jgi:hypothetical protein